MRLEDCTTHGCRLEVLFEGTWGSVCSRGFSDETAQQACGMLGFAHGGELNPTKGGGGSIVWLSDVACTGREGDIGDCKHAVRDRRRRGGGGGGAPRGAEGVSGGGERVGWVDGVSALGLEAANADGDPFRRKDGFLDSVYGSPADEARIERSYSQSFHGDYFEGHFKGHYLHSHLALEVLGMFICGKCVYAEWRTLLVCRMPTRMLCPTETKNFA